MGLRIDFNALLRGSALVRAPPPTCMPKVWLRLALQPEALGKQVGAAAARLRVARSASLAGHERSEKYSCAGRRCSLCGRRNCRRHAPPT